MACPSGPKGNSMRSLFIGTTCREGAGMIGPNPVRASSGTGDTYLSTQ